MKIYMVTSGSYSDYRVDGIYSTREKAEWAHKLYAADNDIEELELDALPETPPGMLNYCVQMRQNGDVLEVRRENARYAIKDEWRPYGDNETVAFSVWAEDETTAIKVANERRTRLIALNQWETDWEKWKRDSAQNEKLTP